MAAIARAADGPTVLVPDQMPHDVFVNALCQALPLAPVERQSLLDELGGADAGQRQPPPIAVSKRVKRPAATA